MKKSKPKQHSEKFEVRVQRMPDGHYVSSGHCDDSQRVYTGEDAKVLDALFGYQQPTRS